MSNGVCRDHVCFLQAVAQHCHQLQHLDIANCARISDEGLVQVAQRCHALNYLNVRDCVAVTDATHSPAPKGGWVLGEREEV